MRSTDEWIAKHDDQKVPDYVRLRVFAANDGICHLSGRKIMAADSWELEHKLALCNGGEHRESNMAPALIKPHKAKTALDLKQRAKNDRVRKRHLGIKKPRTIRQWRKFDGTPVYASRDR